jgi:hypothetical protein
MIPLHGHPFFYWAANSIRGRARLRSLTFVILRQHAEEYGLDRMILGYYPEAVIVKLDSILRGAVLTCLEGLKRVDNDDPVVFNDCDHLFRAASFYRYCDSGPYDDGALLTFESREPKYSFAELDGQGWVKRTVEKVVVSGQAICGAYFFRDKTVFSRAAEKYLGHCSYQEYFISGVYNILSRSGGRIKPFQVDYHLPFGTPEEYRLAEQSPVFDQK